MCRLESGVVLHLLVLLNFDPGFAASRKIFEFAQPNECKRDEYFDTRSFLCLKCDASKNLEPSTDSLQCVCGKFSKTVGFKNGNPLCVVCVPGSIATSDGADCIACKNNVCGCSRNEILMERNLNGTLLATIECLPCPKNTYPSVETSVCLPCDFTRIVHGNCACPTVSHTRVQKYCLPKDDIMEWPDIRSTYLIKFENQNVDSYYLRTELQAAMYLCKNKSGFSCEHLSNMCALTLYTGSVACTLFVQTHIAPVRLFYNEDESARILENKSISQVYSLNKNNANSTLNFTMASFSLEGKFTSIGESRSSCGFLRNVRFGVNLSKRCKVAVNELLSAKMEFLRPYLTFKVDEKDLLHEIPIYIKESHERDDEIARKRLVRKFFLIDNVSGVKAIPSFVSGRFEKNTDVSVLRYMKSLHILVNVQNGQDRGKIFLPLFIVEYGELTEPRSLANTEISMDYKVTFVLKDSHTDADIKISIGIFSGIATIYSGLKAWSYCKHDYNCVPNVAVLVWFFVNAMGAIGNALIFVTAGTCLYVFAFYKGQTVPHVLLTDDSTEKNIQIYIAIAFSLKAVEMIGFVYQHWDIHIFFIDWEQPRTTWRQFSYDSPRTSLRKLYNERSSGDVDASVRTPSQIIAARKKKHSYNSSKDSVSSRASKSLKNERLPAEENESILHSVSRSSIQAEEGAQNLPVSIWRTYAIANEWLKLQAQRRINILFHAICVLFVLEVAGLRSWSLTVPELIVNDELPDVKKSFILQCAVCVLVYVSVYLVQWLISVIFYERYIKNQLQEFIDICSIANISVFILKYTYYGFYIHGRSVHGFADTDLPTLISDLEKEENNLCAHRGLVPGTTEQTFIVSVTETFRNLYDKLYKEKNVTTNKLLKRHVYTSTDWKQVFETRTKIKDFLCQFIDHYFKNEDYIVKEQYLMEKLCDIFRTDVKRKSVFYIDNNHRFDRLTLYGNEWLLATFEMTVFLFVLTLRENYILASTVMVLLSGLLIIIVKYNAKKNLSAKSLLDERFLV